MNGKAIGRPMEILLVEDSLTCARVTMGALKNGNVQHRMTWLTDGSDAIEFLYREGKYTQAPRPDLILLDLGLPGTDGRDVLTRIKSDADLTRIPVVVLTASTDQVDRARSEQLSVESYMTKPVDIGKFLKVVKELERFWHHDMILPAAM